MACQNLKYLAPLAAQFNTFGWLRGRNVQDAYVRGLAIAIGAHSQNIAQDADFLACMESCRGRTIVAQARLMNLFCIIKFYLPAILKGEASIVEFGCYKGGSAIFCAALAKRLSLPIKVFGLDTFAGMPKTDKSIDVHNPADFQDVILTDLNAYKDSLGLDNLRFIQGLFQDTALTVLQQTPPVCLTHIDCDIYESVAYAYDAIKPHMLDGGYYVFDDGTEPTCVGATAAIEDLLIRRDGLNSEQIFPHFVFRAGSKSF